MSSMQAALKRFGLNWVVVNTRYEWGHDIIIIAPCDDGTIPREEVLSRHIPFAFILLIKLLNLGTPVVVRGLITKEEIETDRLYYRELLAAQR